MFSHGKVPSWYFITRGLNLSFASWRTDSTIARCSWLSSSFICNLVLAKLPVSVLACWFWRVASADAAARAERDLHRLANHMLVARLDEVIELPKMLEIGRASVGKECVSTCRSR